MGSNCPPPRSGPHACRRAGAGGVRWRVGTAHRVALKLGHRLERRPTQPEAAPSCQGHGGRWGTAGCRAPQFLCTMPVTSAHPPRRSEPSNEQTGLNVCWGSVSAGDHFERDWRSKQSRVGKGPAWGPDQGPSEGHSPAPSSVAPPAVPPRTWNPTHIYISQQTAGRIYNNAIMRMRFSSVLGTQGLGPWQIQSLLIYPAHLQIKRQLPLPQGGLPARPGQQGSHPLPGRGLMALRSLGTGQRAPAWESLLVLPGGSGPGPGFPEGPSRVLPFAGLG